MKALLQRWFAPHPQLTQHQTERLDAWRALPRVALDVPASETRCVVLDVETTGLNLARDRLISIGAVAVAHGRIALGDSFHVVLQQQSASAKGNILLHGISGTVQREGVMPADALLAFLDFLGKAPLVAFHVAFDETMIRRALREYLGLNFRHPWLDLAYVMPELYPPLAQKHRALDDWIGHFGIRIDVRHDALADALATAQLFQVAHARALERDVASMAGLRGLERAQRWLARAS